MRFCLNVTLLFACAGAQQRVQSHMIPGQGGYTMPFPNPQMMQWPQMPNQYAPPQPYGLPYPPYPNSYGYNQYSAQAFTAPTDKKEKKSKDGFWGWIKGHMYELLIGLLVFLLLFIILFFMCRKPGQVQNTSRSFINDEGWNNNQTEWPSTNPWHKSGESENASGNLTPRVGRTQSLGMKKRQNSLPEGKIRFDVSCTAPLMRKENGYEWLIKCNKLQSRQERKKLSQMTIACCNARNFKTPNGTLRLTKVMQMLHQTRIIRASPVTPTDGFTKFLINDRETFATDVAMKYAAAGQRVVLLNGASKYSAGGGFIRGGRHAMEEALCTQSTLYLSLQRAIGLSETAVHIPDNGVVLSPDVEIFRAGTYQGYEFLDRVLELAGVVSIAMWNMNHKVNDAPVDAPEDPAEYERSVEAKWQAAFEAALSVDPPPKAIVVPDIGCGVYENNPYTVGKIVGKCARAIRGRVDEVIFCGDINFMSAALSIATAKDEL